MLGFLLARAGVRVTVLEKHADFFRDFRGDTIHPSTLQLMHELGLLDDFLKLPHTEMKTVGGEFDDFRFIAGDFSHLPTRCKFVALMPQWDFLNFLADRAKRYPAFELKINHEVVDLIRAGGRVTGVRANTPEGPVEITADLIVAADGRSSVVRAKAGLEVVDLGAPMDVLWMRLSRRPGDNPQESLGHIRAGKILVLINRDTYFQCGMVIPKGTADQIKRRGIEAFRQDIATIIPFARDRVGELTNWDDQIKLLTVQVNHLTRWHLPGLLCIGDAAHAMSPVGGVGINLAIQDAVAAANVLAAPLRRGPVDEQTLSLVQRRRERPTIRTQRMQLRVQNFLFGRMTGKSQKPPLAVWLLAHVPVLRRIPARLIGMGYRPEHIQTPEMPPP